MTREEILAMKAGEKLDKLIAVEIMADSAPTFIPKYALELQLSGSPVKSSGECWLCLCDYNHGDVPIWRPLPFSTDILVAWHVVKKMIKDGYYYFSNYGDNEKWGVTYAHSFGELVWADTVEEAICKAALLTRFEE